VWTCSSTIATSGPACSSPTRSFSASRIASSWASAASRRARVEYQHRRDPEATRVALAEAAAFAQSRLRLGKGDVAA
jgi:hypothetical protein